MHLGSGKPLPEREAESSSGGAGIIGEGMDKIVDGIISQSVKKGMFDNLPGIYNMSFTESVSFGIAFFIQSKVLESPCQRSLGSITLAWT